MQISSSVSSRYYTPYQTNTSVKYFAGFSRTEEGKVIPNETAENPGFAEFVDYQEFHKAWMSQGAETAFSYTKNEGFNTAANSISLVPGMSVRLSNGFRLGSGQHVAGEYQVNTVPEDVETKKEETVKTDIDFSRFAPNVPEEVRKAFSEAAEETGYYEYSGNGKMNHISQILVRQVENRQNGVANYTDVFGGSVASALQAAGEMLYDLENPLMPDSQRRADVVKYREQEKEFYRSFIEKLEGLTGSGAVDAKETVDYAKFLEEKINEIFVKIQNGETEPTYQIGSQSFTEKEWEEFLDRFDSIEEAIRKLMKEEQARKEAEEAKKEGAVINDASTLLTTESTSCVYETADPDDDDLRYITWYTEKGIFCRKAGQTSGYEWSIAFENKEQYDKVMEFIGQFPVDWNMRFAAHENFWNDFLNDEIDMEGFMEFISGTNKGVPDFSIAVGDSVYVDKEKMQWAKYTNPLNARFYTAAEMHRMQMEIIAANKAKLT